MNMNTKNNISCCGIAISGIIFCFLFCKLVFAGSIVNNLQIPENLGRVKEIFEADYLFFSGGRTIIHIQDAHCNYEAQKNMAQILERLINEYGLRLIMVEGGSGDVSLSFLRSRSDKRKREEIAEKYLRKGEISGEEYLNIVSDYDMELYGIEDEELYDANLKSFLDFDSYREEGLRDVERLSSVVEALKLYIYNEALKELEEKKIDYEEKVLSLVEYCQYLKKTAERESLDLRQYDNFIAFTESARLEKEIDFSQAELERNVFVKELAKLLSEYEVRELIDKTKEVKEGVIEPCEYYSFLKGRARNRMDIDRDYPQLNSYIEYIVLSKDINAAELLGELGLLEDEIENALFVENDEKRLSEISKSLSILGKFLKLELPPQEYEYFQEHKPDFSTASWVNFLTDSCRRYNLPHYPSVSYTIDDNLDKLDDFYQLGIKREKAFFDNMAEKLDESGEKIAVLITGGFHTPRLTCMLKDEGYSYAVVTPVISEKDDAGTYFAVLRSEKSRLDKAPGYKESGSRE